MAAKLTRKSSLKIFVCISLHYSIALQWQQWQQCIATRMRRIHYLLHCDRLLQFAAKINENKSVKRIEQVPVIWNESALSNFQNYISSSNTSRRSLLWNENNLSHTKKGKSLSLAKNSRRARTRFSSPLFFFISVFLFSAVKFISWPARKWSRDVNG